MARRDEWETDPYGDPTEQAGAPWDLASTGDPVQAPVESVQAQSGDPGSAQTSAGGDETYDAHLTNIGQAADPAQQAQAQDDLARQLHTDLAADGHDVKWTGATALTIDGRQYELGDGSTGGDTTYNPGPTPGFLPGADVPNPPPSTTGAAQQSGYVNPDGSAGGYLDVPAGGWQINPDGSVANLPSGFHWDPNFAAVVKDAATTQTTGYGGGDDQSILSLLQGGMDPQEAVSQFNQKNGRSTGNEAVYYNDSRGITIGLPGGYAALTPNGWTWTNRVPETGGGGQTSPWLSTSQPTTNTTYPAWSPSAPDYNPDFIDESASELPGYDDIMAALSTPGAGDAELQKLVQSIVEHPETLTDQDIERLKAKSAEEAAVASQSQDEDLQHYGYNAGLDSSPWLAGQRAQNAWNRSSSTISANRDIDISAASQRNADRQQAAQIGTAYSSFQSSKKAQAVGLAVTAALGKAGEQRSRHQLNESLKQAATQLGLTKDNLVMTYLNHAMDDLTRNKQIDLNFDVDMKKLAEQSDEFKQTLLQRIHEMSQQDDQFTANYGLALQEFQHKKDTDAWDRAKATVGA